MADAQDSLNVYDRGVLYTQAEVDAIAAARNLTPFFSADFTDTSYWVSLSEVYTDVGDGWVHVEYDNTESAAQTLLPFFIAAQDFVVDNGSYTLMVELRNVVAAPSYIDAATNTANQISSTQFKGLVAGRNYKVLNARADVSACTRLGAFRCRVAPNSTLNYDMRASLYSGEYAGPYKPYCPSYAEIKALAARSGTNSLLASKLGNAGLDVADEDGKTV